MLFFLFALAFADVPKNYEVPKKLAYDDIRGGVLYGDLCWQCHGKTGQGDGPLSAELGAPPLYGKVSVDNVSELVDIVQWGKGKMPAYEQLIDKHDTKRILKWLRCINGETGKNNCDANRRKKKNSKKKPEAKQQSSSVGCNSFHLSLQGVLPLLFVFSLLFMRKRK